MISTGKTIKLRRTLRTLDHPLIILGVAINLALIATIMMQVMSASTPSQAATVTPGLVMIIASPTFAPPTPGAQVAATGPNLTPRALVAYDAPDGRALGAIEQGRHYQVLASWGAAWLQADVTGSGVVWLRAADLLGMPGGLVDLQPTAAPRIVVVSAPAPEQRYQVDAAPTPAACYHSERQIMLHGVSLGLATGDSCISQQLADEQAAASAFAQMNAALQGGR
jgi:hypothetical protein